MRKLYALPLMLLSLAANAGFDGSAPMACEPTKGFDCTADSKTCNNLKPESDTKLEIKIDVGSKEVQTPYRTDKLPITNTSTNQTSLVLQGTSLEMAWSTTINHETGKMTLAIADREGAFVIFGQCALAAPAQ